MRNILSREILDLIHIFDFLAYILHHAIQIIIPFEKKVTGTMILVVSHHLGDT